MSKFQQVEFNVFERSLEGVDAYKEWLVEHYEKENITLLSFDYMLIEDAKGEILYKIVILIEDPKLGNGKG